MTRSVVVATASTDLREGGDRLLELVGWLRGRGVDVELLALGEGWDLRRFRATCPTVVVDEFRRRGPARIPAALGLHGVAGAAKSLRLRAWLRARRDRVFLVHDPMAASLLRFLPTAPARVVAGLPHEDVHLADLRPEDLESLRGAHGWVVSSAAQVEEVGRATNRPVVLLGDVVDPASLPEVHDPDPGRGAVCLVGAVDPWEDVDVAAELAWLLHRELPDVPLRWLVSDERSAWLARHDVRHAGLAGTVEVVASDGPDALRGAGIVVRTSVRPGPAPALVAAAVAGVPVLDVARPPLDWATACSAVDLESVVELVAALAGDAELARDSGERARSAVPVAPLEHRAEPVLRLLFD